MAVIATTTLVSGQETFVPVAVEVDPPDSGEIDNVVVKQAIATSSSSSGTAEAVDEVDPPDNGEIDSVNVTVDEVDPPDSGEIDNVVVKQAIATSSSRSRTADAVDEIDPPDSGEIDSVNVTEPPLVGTSYCTYAPDYSCYATGWPSCCSVDFTTCPEERPPCETDEVDQPDNGEIDNVNVTEPPLVGTSYCTYAPDYSCYATGWPSCCSDATTCPKERPPCETNGGLGTGVKPPAQCPLVLGCCEEDCCGEGTSWESPSCILNPDSSGFDGTYSSEYNEGCILRSCCENECCSDGTEYDSSTALCVPEGTTPPPPPLPTRHPCPEPAPGTVCIDLFAPVLCDGCYYTNQCWATASDPSFTADTCLPLRDPETCPKPAPDSVCVALFAPVLCDGCYYTNQCWATVSDPSFTADTCLELKNV